MAGTTPNVISLPTYIALGTGTGTATDLDTYLFKEGYGARAQFTASTSPQAFIGQIATTFTASSNTTWTEIGMFDQAPPTTNLSAPATGGDTSISIDSVYFTIPTGQPIYIFDGTSSEYANVSAQEAPGTTILPLQSPLTYNHASGVQVVVFSGNMFSHIILTTPFQQVSGEALTVQWQFQVS